MGKKDGKPRGRMSSYAFFVQTCREEHKKKHPGETVVFGEFAKKCSEKWKSMGAKEKKRFEDMATKDKTRYDKEMASYSPPAGEAGGRKRKRTKDPNAPKRNLSAFFFFCADERPQVRKAHPQWTVGDVAKELGRRWEDVKDKTKYEKSAEKDKARYEMEMAAYRGGGSPKKAAASPAKKVKQVEEDEDEDDDEDEEEEEEEDDDDDDDE